MTNFAKGFARSENGYVLEITLLFLPVFLGVALLVIDLGRANNAHSDLQATVDAVAIAGAIELDGDTDAITRAKAAMAELENTVAFVGDDGDFHETLAYEDVQGNAFTAIFLEAIPTNDHEPIDQTWVNAHGTTDGAQARFVYVHARTDDLRTIFPEPLLGPLVDLPIAAIAVATNPGPTACNVPPIYVCNPFEGTANPDFSQRFASGDVYGRLFELHFVEASSPGPGNFGFLRVATGPGASDLREALATGDSEACYEQRGVDTKPGQNTGPVDQAINTHFGLYAGVYSPASRRNDPKYRPARNVRMGQRQQGNTCREYDPIDDDSNEGMALPRGETMVAIPGGYVSTGPEWDIDRYWDINHGGHTTAPPSGYTPPAAPVDDIRAYSSTHPFGYTPDTVTPSRYDTYTYELSDDAFLYDAAPNGEVGYPQTACSTVNPDDYLPPAFRDRRVVFAAVLNCVEQNLQGAATDVPAEAFVKMFLTKPAIVQGNTKYLSLEIIDKTGDGGLGAMDDMVREESFLVR